MPITTRTHAVLDFATAGLLLVAPRLFRAGDRFTRAATTLALGKVAQSLLTRHEGGVVRLVPMPVHLALDVATGVATAALPFLVREKHTPSLLACTVGAALVDLVAAPSTDRRSLPPRVRGVTTGTTATLPGE